MPDYDKIGREVRAIFTAFPVEPETEEGRMVADLRYPGWRERGMPPAVPTPEAVERWGDQWWRLVHSDGSAVEPPSDTLQVVMVCGDGYFYEQGNDTTQEFVDDGRWFGPVLERPVKP